MDDIEGGQLRPGQGAPDSAADRRSPTGSWLGSLLNRPRSAPQPDGLDSRAPSRFSAVPEESSQHTRAASSNGTDDPFAGLYASSASSGGQQQQQGRHRKGGLNRQADNLEHLYSSSYTRPPTAYADSNREGGGLDSSSAASAPAGGSSSSRGQQQQQGPRWSSPSGQGSEPAPQVNAMGDVLVGRMSMQVKVSEGAQRKFIHMVQEEDVSAQIESSKRWGSRGVIHPLDRRYRAWWYLTVGAAAFTGWLTTYRLAFVPMAGYRDLRTKPEPSGASVLESILLAVFLADIVVSFFVGYYDESGLLVLDNRRVSTYYLRRRFLLDILTTLPWDEVVMTATGIHGDTTEGRYIALLSLLKLGRMYRLVVMFYNISYNLSVGLLTLTLLRNFTFCFYLLHWAACGFWFVALQEGGHANKKTWVAQQAEMLDGSSTVELYIFSFYWSLVTFATLGYGDVTPHTTAEVVFTIVYVAFNIVVWAYVLGTITLLVTKQDTELGVYRERMQSLTSYCNANNLPHELKQTMAGLLRLHMSLQNEAQGDEQVLSIFPTTIRRRILRQLYSNSLQGCYLFKDTGVKFLDALMLGARVELFLPKVEIVSALDHANELYIVVAGYVEVVDPTLVGKTAELMREGEKDDREAQNQQQLQLLDAGAENAFTAGMVTPQQLQHAATIGQHPASTLPTHSRLMPLIEGQQHHDTPDPLQPGTGRKHPQHSSSTGAQGHSPRHVQFPAKSAPRGLLQRLPGGKRLQVWMAAGRKDSYRKQQEQLQKDKYDINQVPFQALAKHSRTLSSRSAMSEPGTGGSGKQYSSDHQRQYNDHKIPAFAMRNLHSTSKLPRLAHSSGGSSSKGVGAMSADTQAQQDQMPPELGATPGRVQLGPGDCFAEVAYFTEVPKAEAVRSLTICRVLVIPRSTYNAVARDFPLSARQVLENLKKRAQQLVEEFLPRDLARELMRGADAQDAAATAAAAAAADSSGEGYAAAAAAGAGDRQQQGDGAAYKHLSPFSSSDVQRAGDAVDAAVAAVEAEDRFQQQQQQQQQQGESAGSSRPRSPLAPRSSAPPTSFASAAATTAAMRRLTPAAVAAAAAAAAARQSSSGGGGGGCGRKERPLLSSMSVNLSGRYNTPGGHGSAAGSGNPRKSLELGRLHSRSSEAAMFRRKSVDAAELGGIGDMSGATSPRSTSSADPTTADDRAARALARFTVSVNPRVRGASAAASDAELLARAGEGVPPAVVRSSTMSPEAVSGQPLSPRQHKQRADSEAQRMLTTMSLLPQGTMRHADMARAWEGLPQQQQQQQQQGLSIVTSPADGGPSAQQNQAAAAAAAAAGAGGGGKQWTPALIKSAGLGYEEGSRIYSDEEVQAVAAALPAPLTLQQQRLLADLLRLKRLVNKAAAKYDQMQLTSFLDAAANGDVDVVQDMLRQGMNPNTCDYDGRTALMIAAYKGHKDVVLALLFAGADTSPKDARGFDVMIEGARGNREDIIDVLKRSGARTGISIMLQASLLCKATYEGKMDRLGLLLRSGCEADAHDYDGQTALHVAAAEGSLAAARVLIQAGASLTIKDRWGYNPLDVAYKVGAAPLVEYLAAQAAPDVASAAAEGWKRERTEAALAAARYGDTAALARLLDRGCPVDAADYDGRSLLHVAVHNKQEAVVRQLLAAGADPNVRSSSGSSPLLEAAMDGSTAIQSELMSAGARLGLPATEEAALLSGVLHAHRHDQLLALLTAGADPAAADYDSRTPLHIAGSLGDLGALQLMADALADSGIERLTCVNWQATDRWGDTPLQEAQRAGHAEAAVFLQQQITQQQQQQQQQHQQKSSTVRAAGASK